MQLIQNDSAQMAAAMDGLERITAIIHRYIEVEKVYWNTVAPKEHFEEAVVSLYCKVLEYQAKCAHHFRISTAKRTLKNIGKTENWAELMTNIHTDDVACVAFSQTLSFTHLAAVLDEQTQYMKMKESLEKQRQIETENTKIVQWVSNISVFDDHDYVRSTKLGSDHWDSGTWLLRKRAFKEWKQSPQGEIWLHGTVGTGKSCLTSIVINDLVETFTNERLAFFYCSRDKEYTSIDVFRSLVAQLSTSANGESITPDIKAYYESNIRQHPKGSILSLEQCENYMVDFINLYGSTTVVIDALDECCPSAAKLLLHLKNVSERSQKLKLFLSSRDDVPVSEYFSEGVQIRVHSTENSEDIKSFIEGEFAKPERRNSLVIGDELVQRLQTALICRAEGM
jgi:hypothetical protein